MIVIRQHRIFRADLRANPYITYLFGDNLMRKGMGGQAFHMRREPNAVGIPTKHEPTTYEYAYFTDADFEMVKPIIDADFDRIQTDIVIVPLDGIGTGLSQLDKRAPKIFKYIEDKIDELQRVQINING